MEFSDYLAIIRRRWLVIITIAVAVGGGLSSWSIGREVVLFTAESQVGIRDERRVGTAVEVAQSVLAETSSGYSYFTREALITSRPVYQMAAAIYLTYIDDRTKLTREFWKDSDDDAIFRAIVAKGLMTEVPVAGRPVDVGLVDAKLREAAVDLEGNIRVARPADKAQLLAVRATSQDRSKAILMANAFARGAQIYSRAQATVIIDRAARDVNTNIAETLAQIKAKERELGVTEDELSAIESRRKAVEQACYDLERLAQERMVRQEQVLNRIQGIGQVDHRQRNVPPSGPAEDISFSSTLLDRLRGEMVSLKADMGMKRVAWTEENPEYKRMGARLAQLQDEYNLEVQRERERVIMGLREEMEGLDIEVRSLHDRHAQKVKELDDLKDEVRRRDPPRAELVRLRKALDSYDESRRKLASARTVQQGFYGFEEAAEEAYPGERKGWRTVPMYALLGTILAFAMAFMMEYLDTSIRSDYDLKRHLNLPCLAMIEDAGGSDPLILRASPRGPMSELFNLSSTVLQSYFAEREFKTCVVCSAVPREGKTTVAANLAVALARKGLRVVLADTDLRLPQVHNAFNLDNSKGLSSYLRGEEGMTLEVVTATTELPTLHILPSGPIPDSPVELIESSRMADLVKILRERYDILICDSPPITSVGDALTLSRMVDTVVMVVGAGLSDRRMVTWTKQLLTNVRADISGVILNFSRARAGAKYYYYYYAYGAAGRGGSNRHKSVRARD